MSGSRWAAVTDAVIALLDAQLSMPVFDGIPVTSDFIADAVIVGNQPGRDDGAAGLISQEYHEVGVGAKRNEVGEIRCAAISQTGDDTLSTVRANALATVALVESALRTSVNLGLADLLYVEVRVGEVLQGATTRGVFAECRFTIGYTALI